MKRAVLYTRISRETEESISIARQERELREAADREGWQVVEVIVDAGLSGRFERTEAARALRMLRDRQTDVLMVWALDRWSRQGLRAMGELVGALDDAPGTLFVALRDGVRSDRKDWRLTAGVLSEVARMETESTQARIQAMRAHHLAATEPGAQRHLGGRTPFGYVARKRLGAPGVELLVDDFEAEVVREGARRLLTGTTIADLTRWLAAEKVPTAQSAARRARQQGNATDDLPRGEWRMSTVRALWRSETLLGRTTRDVPLLDEANEPIKNSAGKAIVERRAVEDANGLPITRWTPIVDPATFAALRQALPDSGRVQPRRRRSFVAGFAMCGLCGGPLYVHDRKDGRTPQLRCASRNVPDRTCPTVSIAVALAESAVERHFLRGFGGLAELREERETIAPDTQRALAEVAQAIEDTKAAFARDGADYSALADRMAALAERRRALQGTAPLEHVRHVPTGRTLGDAWATLRETGDLDGLRDLLLLVFDHVEVSPPVGDPRTTDPLSRLRFRPRVTDSDLYPTDA